MLGKHGTIDRVAHEYTDQCGDVPPSHQFSRSHITASNSDISLSDKKIDLHRNPAPTLSSATKRRYSILSPTLSPIATSKANKSSIPSLKARKHKPKVSSPLTVTNVIKNSLNLTASSSSKSPNEKENLTPDDAHVTPSSSEIHRPMHVATTLPLVDYDHVSTPEWVLHFQKTFREHEQRFAQMDILVDQITYLRTKLEQTQV
ncbi:hypothetical protein BDB01DRAFT_906137 [Pilobolus umbonatus]|nr:hypothetical protein BDB01DRAFT_906137 [Pilobolus umbonatus]